MTYLQKRYLSDPSWISLAKHRAVAYIKAAESKRARWRSLWWGSWHFWLLKRKSSASPKILSEHRIHSTEQCTDTVVLTAAGLCFSQWATIDLDKYALQRRIPQHQNSARFRSLLEWSSRMVYNGHLIDGTLTLRSSMSHAHPNLIWKM